MNIAADYRNKKKPNYSFTASLTPYIQNKLVQCAIKQKRTRSSIINEALGNYFERFEMETRMFLETPHTASKGGNPIDLE